MRPGTFFIRLLPFFAWAALLPSHALGTDVPYELSATTLAPHVDFQADLMEYDSSSKTMLLRGHAVITDSTMTLRSEEIRLDQEKEEFESPVPLEVGDKISGLKAESGRFRFAAQEGWFKKASVRVAPWTFKARRLHLKKDRYIMYRAGSTSCDAEPPHYRFKATRITFIPGRRLTSWNNVFYLGPVPILYFPVFYRSLRPAPPYVTKVHLGYDGRNGGEVQTDTTLRISRTAYNRLYLDYYTRQGFGYGDEVNYRKEGAYKGTVYAYRIDETSSRRARWGVAGDHWQKLPGAYYTQGRMDLLSDPSFNNTYNRAHDIRVAPELNNSVALVRQTQLTTTRLSYSRRDYSINPYNKDEFLWTQESAPRLDFQAADFKVPGLPVLNRVTAFADRSIDSQFRNYYQNTAGTTWVMTQRLRLLRRVSFVPSAGYSETYEDRVDFSTPTYNRYTGRYFTTADLRFQTPCGDMTVGHRFTRQLAVNKLREDRGSDDHGVKTHLVTAENAYRPNLWSRLTVSSAYDLRRHRLSSVKVTNSRDRIQPIIGDVYLQPVPMFSLAIRELYCVGTGDSYINPSCIKEGHQSINVQADYGFPQDTHLGAGFSQTQNPADPGKVYASTTFGYYPKGRTWSLEGALRYALKGEGRMETFRFYSAQVFEKELSVKKRWHDFIGRFSFRDRPGGVREFQFRIDLKVGKAPEEDVLRQKAWEEEWYPWRQGMKDR